MSYNSIVGILLVVVIVGCENGNSNSSSDTSNGEITSLSAPTSTNIEVSIDSTIQKTVSNNSLLEKRKDLEVIDEYITYNDEFEPTLNMKIQNHHEKTIVAIEVEVSLFEDGYSYACPEKTTIQKKINLKPEKISTVQLKVTGVSDSCKPVTGYVTDYVFSDGTKPEKNIQAVINESLRRNQGKESSLHTTKQPNEK